MRDTIREFKKYNQSVSEIQTVNERINQRFQRNITRESIRDTTGVCEIQPESQRKIQPEILREIQPDSMRNTTRVEGKYNQRV